MTNIWEQNIREWYEKSETSRLNYLDLALTEKPSTKELAHNIAVIYDRVQEQQEYIRWCEAEMKRLLRSWLGLLNYARQYIKDLGRLLSPLY